MTWVAEVVSGRIFSFDQAPQPVVQAPVPRAKPAAGQPEGLSSFADLIDVINPLQHIPGVAELYRRMTGDEISDGARFAGNALYGLAAGGPLGLGAMTAYSFAGAAAEGLSGTNPLPVVDPAAEAPTADVEPAPFASGPVPDATRTTNGAILGMDIAGTGLAGAGGPVDLAALLGDPPQPPTKPAPVESARAEPAVSEAALEKLAAHKANHLPLDVLKALQERHAVRAAHEPS